MKPHLIVKLAPGHPALGLGEIPDWQAVVGGRPAPRGLVAPVDRILRGHGIDVQATREYQPAGRVWSEDERHCGFDRIYRLVLRRDHRLPESIVRQIRLVPFVEAADRGAVGAVPLPTMQPVGGRGRPGEESRRAIGLADAHVYSKGHPDVVIGVLDTGVDVDHPALGNAMEPGADFVDILDGAERFLGDRAGVDADPDDEVGHGTHVAGVIVGHGDRIPLGVAPRCRLLPVRVLAAMRKGKRRVGAGLVDNINTGVKWAIDKGGASVINMSLGVRHEGGGLPHREVIEYAQRKGVTVVAAAGNDGREQLYYPGAYPSVIAVGSIGPGFEVSRFSTYGPHISFVAPGELVYSSWLEGGYAQSSGTSHATPFVSGTAALIRSYARERGRELDDAAVKSVMRQTSDRIDGRPHHLKAGYGRINAADAMRFVHAKLN